MKLYKLLKNIKCRVVGNINIEISGLYHFDKDVKKEGLFFCINGTNVDGLNYVENAIKNGAVAIVVEREIIGIKNVVQIITKNIRKTMSLMSCIFYDFPAKKLKMIGVTGTNGKTTTTHMLADCLNKQKIKSAIIGTNGVKYNGKIIETSMTTPDPIELQKILHELVKNNIECVCMEVSAHALFLDKIEGIIFDYVIFTNLTEDHLDFFKTMQNYFSAKQKLFTPKYTKCAIINVDDDYGKKLSCSIKIPYVTYAIYNQADYFAENIKIENYMQSFNISNVKITSRFLGDFNVYNLLAVIAFLNQMNFDLETISKLVGEIKQVDGRFNTIIKNDKLFVIDYAHTPDGLENVLKLCNQIKKDKKLVCLFGCGGDRETQKRSKMGKISSKIADFTIISSDNPRFEPREKIAADIESGIKNENYKVILDRCEAIKYANSITNVGDVILVAGKGAEKYIDENGRKTYYSDFEQIEKL